MEVNRWNGRKEGLVLSKWLCAKKTNWLKLGNANDDTKHAASFPLETRGNDALDPWLTRKTFWWHVFISEVYYLKCDIFMYKIHNYLYIIY